MENEEQEMQSTGQAAAWGEAGRKRVEAVVESLANSRCAGESLAEVAHDARNMVTALGLYCDLLQEPGVLAPSYLHYGHELRLVAAASRRLVERLVVLDTLNGPDVEAVAGLSREPGKRPVQAVHPGQLRQVQCWDLLPAVPLESLAGEVLANRTLLAALAGPTIALTMDIAGGALPVKLTGEDLTRVLVNLVKNSSEAMPAGGRIQLRLEERASPQGRPELLVLTVDDSGPGIPKDDMQEIFAAGFSTKPAAWNGTEWPTTHRGLGLSITRSIIEAAGGQIVAASRDLPGARFQIELPVRMH
jgi:signal transduction histidine kinase